ncbi:diguanylate cyclase (GGDEF)-like protein [Saccharothrix tamanrassetensis]|uniref:Diguanylate cyclase (GGDEF)-like protein n=1 Tax=Saccharothrix tamanrassetensis TaxID=1051531 RepID=A0A841CB70_9PSEU|nr:diguanylate cyclase [Saccharothrix tamanrassetensis]MBB5953594.1 diguanylate cyclase (GGDEF)-like protein [Saccharothrix tamanrassetensis]
MGDAAVLVLDAGDLGVRWASPAAERLLGGASGPLTGLVAAEDAPVVGAFLRSVVGRQGASRCTCAVPADRRVDLIARDLSDTEVGGVAVVALDVTGWAALADGSHRPDTDPLTGLANRTGILRRLEQAIRDAPAQGPGPVLLFLDLDRFKAVNRHGQDVGDEVLRVVAARLDAMVDGRGSTARSGGDEFVVLLDRTTEDAAVEAAGQIAAAIGTPVRVGDVLVTPTVSVGIARLHGGQRLDDLLCQVDLALFRAKSAAGPVVYRPELDDWVLARKHETQRLAERLEQLHLENQALAEAATIDQRTGLPNAAAFDADQARRHRAGERYSLLIVDIDWFHSYNNHYRYLAGHEALRAVGEAIRRTAGRCFRYGGEEFAVLLTATGYRDAVDVGERIREAVQRLGIEHRATPTGVVTVSVGVVEAAPGALPTDVVERANVALLQAKDAGRNRVVGFRGGCPLRVGG